MDPIRKSGDLASAQSTEKSAVESSVSSEQDISKQQAVNKEQVATNRTNQTAKKTNSIFSFISKLFKKEAADQPEATKPKELKRERFRHLASGKAKKVYEDKSSSKFVYYTPSTGVLEKIFGRKKSEIQEEVKIAANVKNALASSGLDPEQETYLATDLKEVAGSDNLEGRYVVQAPRAGEKSDLNALLQDKIPFSERLGLCENILKGLTHLHQAGYVHGDLKGDNILHFKEVQPNGEVKSILRISDYGKSKKVDEEESVLHTGNQRFVAPEGRSSKKAEVFSAALLLVRVLEEEALQKTGKNAVLKPVLLKRDQKGENLRGIEKFVVTNDNCVQSSSRNILGKIRLIAGSARAIANVRWDKEKTTTYEVNKYINTLFSILKEGKSPDEIKALEAMQILLLNMVSTDPSKRPSMPDVLQRFETILQHYRGGIQS